MDIIRDIYMFNSEVRKAPQPDQPQKLSDDNHQARFEFMEEEINEFQEATTPQDELDALIDVIYFAVGGIYDLGLTHEQAKEAFCRVHHANMAKVAGVKEGRSVTTQDAAKPEEWPEPDLGSFF